MRILNDFNTTVEKALSEIDPKWRNYDGLIVCGTHHAHLGNAEIMIDAISEARKDKTPFLGICFGHQLAAIENARNVLGIDDATSEEFGNGTFVVKKREKLKVGLHEGETWWNHYEVDENILNEWKNPDHFITVQYHPEYQSSKDKPHPILVEFLNLCRK